MKKLIVSLCLTAVAAFSQPAGAEWATLGTGMDSSVDALAVYHGALIAGGSFAKAGGIPASCIARWDGVSWSPLGSGLNSTVFAMTVYNDLLVVAGAFTTAGGKPAHGIASWDGSSWSAIGDDPVPFSGLIHALTPYQGSLIVGGLFWASQGAPGDNIARWTGSAWKPLGSGLPGGVASLMVYNGKLVAGGAFTPIGRGYHGSDIAEWDDLAQTWVDVGCGLAGGADGLISCMSTLNGSLIAGGWFLYECGTEDVCNVAAFADPWWTGLGTGLNGVQALASYQGLLFAGGVTSDCNGYHSFHYLASWDGSVWSEVGSGLDCPAYTMAVYDDALVVGGCFKHAGAMPASYIVQWIDPASVPGGAENGAPAGRVYPNPTSGPCRVSFRLPSDGPVTVEIMDVAGRTVRRLLGGSHSAGDYALTWDGRDDYGRVAPPGVYLSRVRTPQRMITGRVVLIK